MKADTERELPIRSVLPLQQIEHKVGGSLLVVDAVEDAGVCFVSPIPAWQSTLEFGDYESTTVSRDRCAFATE